MDPFDPKQAPGLAAEARDRIRLSRLEQVLPDRFRAASLLDVRSLHGDDVWRPLAQWTASPGSGLVLLGPVGTGKTYAAAAVLAALASDRSIGFVSAPQLFVSLRPGGGSTLTPFCYVDVLVVDDVGSERPTDWSAEQLNALVDIRYLASRPTIVTSNLSPADLRDHLGDRAWSRLTDHQSLVLRFAGADHRKDNPPS